MFDIETNGVVSPVDAMALAANILREQLELFVNFDDIPILHGLVDVSAPKWNLNLFRRVEDMELSVRSANGLKNSGIVHIGDLVQQSASDLLKIPNFGRKSLFEVNEVLKGMELSLGMPLEGWPPDDVEAISRQFDAEYL